MVSWRVRVSVTAAPMALLPAVRRGGARSATWLVGGCCQLHRGCFDFEGNHDGPPGRVSIPVRHAPVATPRLRHLSGVARDSPLSAYVRQAAASARRCSFVPPPRGCLCRRRSNGEARGATIALNSIAPCGAQAVGRRRVGSKTAL